jgi:hypothetical protein
MTATKCIPNTTITNVIRYRFHFWGQAKKHDNSNTLSETLFAKGSKISPAERRGIRRKVGIHDGNLDE